MNADDKRFLLERLTESHSAIQAMLKGIDFEMRVYTDTDWRVRDILGPLWLSCYLSVFELISQLVQEVRLF
jgi:hypothetical protein